MPAPVQGSGSGPELKNLTPLVRDAAADPESDAEFVRVSQLPGVLSWRNLAKDSADSKWQSPAYKGTKTAQADIVLLGMVTPKGHYMFEVDRRAFGDAFAGMPTTAEPGGDSVQAPGLAPQGWSGGVDNRVLTSGHNKQGRVNGGCSGALIGARIVRTAAHCIVGHNTSGTGVLPGTVPFNYKEDNTTWGTQVVAGTYFYGGAYIGSNCAKSTSVPSDYWSGYRGNFDACTWADWGYLILDPNWWGAGGHNWFGYSKTVSVGLDLVGGGYPVCGQAGAPTTCSTVGSYFQDDSANCEVKSFTSGTSKFKAGCDTSGGNSGGPVWRRGSSILLGHCQWEDCNGSACTGAGPNHFLGHDDWLFDYQQTLRATYP